MMTKTLPKGRRLYQVWKGNNKFYCGGRLIFGPDASSVLLTAVLIGGPAVAFWSLSIANVNKSDTVLGPPVLSVAIIVTILDLLFLFLTSGRDPGIIPRKLHPREDPTEFGTYSMEWINGKAPHLRLPRMKDVLVNGVIVKVKYCDTCYLYRPARASHCSICNNCVQRFDHHCPWVGQCIGERNYRFFILFISFATFLCIYVFTFSLLNIIRKNKHGISIWDTMSKEILSVVLIIYCFIAVWFVGGLTIFHFFLISTNQTTYENFRYRYDKKENPYNKGIVRNFKDLFFSKMPASLNDFRSWIQDDFDESDTQSVGACIGSIDKGDLEMGREHEGGDMRVPSILQSLDYNGIDDNLRRNGKEYNSFDPFFSVDQESRDSIHSYTTIGTIVSEMTVEQNGLHGMTMFIDHDGRNIQL